MTRKAFIPDLDHLIMRYQAGEAAQALAKEIGVGNKVLAGQMRDAGVVLRGRDAKRPVPDLAALIERYRAGEPITLLAAEAGVAQLTLARRMRERGIETRTVADTIHRAHDAVRGRRYTDEELEVHAKARERGEGYMRQSPAQRKLAALLTERTTAMVKPEKAVGKYNVDIAIGHTVAVEVMGGGWHTKKAHRERCTYIFDQGWNLAFVWWEERRGHSIDIPAAVDVLAFFDRTQADPAFRRQSRVIWGSGELIATGCADCDEWTLVGPGKRRMR